MRKSNSLATCALIALSMTIVLPASALVVTPPPPEVMVQGGIPYLSGGVGKVERAQIEAIAESFDLKLVFSGRSGAYLADVGVQIVDASDGRTILDVVSEGPWLFVDLPAGRYHITATKLGQAFERTVNIGTKQTEVQFTRWAAASERLARQ